jgi:hypothetical protein
LKKSIFYLKKCDWLSKQLATVNQSKAACLNVAKNKLDRWGKNDILDFEAHRSGARFGI